MRFSLLLASTALVASLTVSACSSDRSQAIPTDSTMAPMGHRAPHVVMAGGDATCGAGFHICVTLHPGKTTTELCVSTTYNCSSGIVGYWYWVGTVVTYPKGKKYRKIKVSYSPNPGNPVINTFKVRKLKNTHGKVKWVEKIETCNSSSSCLAIPIGLIGG